MRDRAARAVGAAVLLGAALWLLRPVYLLTEVVAAAGTRGGYSFAGDTVSDLGVLGCVTGAGGGELCSPWHAVMNGSFVLFGVTLALGALLLVPALARTGSTVTAGAGWRDRRVRLAILAWVVAGASSVATGLAPVDRDAALHYAVALPVFVAQPLGLLLLAVLLREAGSRRTAVVLVVAALLSAVGALGFGVLLPDDAAGRGAVERLALWPTFLVLPLVAWAVGGRRSGPVSSRGSERPTS